MMLQNNGKSEFYCAVVTASSFQQKPRRMDRMQRRAGKNTDGDTNCEAYGNTNGNTNCKTDRNTNGNTNGNTGGNFVEKRICSPVLKMERMDLPDVERQ